MCLALWFATKSHILHMQVEGFPHENRQKQVVLKQEKIMAWFLNDLNF